MSEPSTWSWVQHGLASVTDPAGWQRWAQPSCGLPALAGRSRTQGFYCCAGQMVWKGMIKLQQEEAVPEQRASPCCSEGLVSCTVLHSAEILFSVQRSFTWYLVKLRFYLSGFLPFFQVIHFLHHSYPGEGQKGLIFVRFVKIFLCL